ncbi:MAG: prepilin peptidase [Oscillospiraceae bacterium]|nr:prepilin peptidase [Oscillospiraceae bacterium]MBR4346920.1 prepilin peptidase [Oscillospiraceae bacterium]
MDIEKAELMLNIFIYVFAFLFGITIGSFLNVCILRLPRGESLITNNSHCMTCGAQIKRYDLIPVFSWLILRGKCRNCGAPISPRYMLVEAMTGFLFVGVFAKYPPMDFGLYPVLLCLFICGLIVLCFQDIDNREMVVSVLVYTCIIAVVTRVLGYLSTAGLLPVSCLLPEESIKSALIGMVSVSGVLFIFGFIITPLFYDTFVDENKKELRMLKKQLRAAEKGSHDAKKLNDKISSLTEKINKEEPVYGFGMGDIILMAAGGLMFGVKATVTAAFIAVICAAVYGVYRRIVSDDEDNAFAFGPFLIVGLVIVAFIGNTLADAWLSTLYIDR